MLCSIATETINTKFSNPVGLPVNQVFGDCLRSIFSASILFCFQNRREGDGLLRFSNEIRQACQRHRNVISPGCLITRKRSTNPLMTPPAPVPLVTFVINIVMITVPVLVFTRLPVITLILIGIFFHYVDIKITDVLQSRVTNVINDGIPN